MPASEEEKRAQEARSRRYGIGIKPDGNVTMPAEHKRRWPSLTDEDYLDPVNYRYPCPNAEQTRVAARYWGQPDNQEQYTEAEREIISRRLEEKKKKFKIGEYAQENTFAVTLASDLAGQVPEWIQLLPFGQVRSVKGDFTVDEESLAEIISYFKARGNDIVIDYEHQTLDGGQAPAAGWIKELEDRGPDGLWARVEWTGRAKEYLANKEYRYLSPVVLVRRADNKAVAIHSVALTNAPAMSGVRPIVNKHGKEDDKMPKFMEELARLLGLTGQPDEVKLLEAVKALKDKPQPPAHKEVLELLDLKEDAGLAEVKGRVIALKNPSGYVRVEEFKALQDKLAQRERDELVARALAEGKITPAQKEWAEQYALKDQEGFKAFLEQAPQVVPLKPAPGGGPGKPATAVDDVQALVNKMLGVSDEDFKKYGGMEV